MELAQRIEQARTVCRQALESADLARSAGALDDAALSPAALLQMLRLGARRGKPAPVLRSCRAKLASTGAPAAFERTVLLRAALPALDALAALPLEESVKHLVCKELMFYACPKPAMLPRFELESRSFAAMSGVVSFARFPAGQYQWVISGIPRSWLLKVPPRSIPAVCRFLVFQARGFRPMFELHLGGGLLPVGFASDRQYYRSFYRMAASLERQPEIKGIMAASWLYSRETHRVSPHLAFYSAPYAEAGGLEVELGAAAPEDGFLEGSPERAGLYQAGAYRPTRTLVACSREQALSWMRAHRSLEAEIEVR